MNSDVVRWKQFSTATVSDALDRLRIPTQCFGLVPVSATELIVGRAFTVRMEPAGVVKGTVGDYVDDVPEGHIVAIDNGGRLDATAWGDLLTTVAHRRGIVGTVIHGVCRDLATSRKLGYPIFSRSHYMRTGKDRVQADAFDVPISLGEVRVESRDLIIADTDGVVVVPKIHEDTVYGHACEIHAAEENILRAIEQGMRLDAARKEFGYFKLQRVPGSTAS